MMNGRCELRFTVVTYLLSGYFLPHSQSRSLGADESSYIIVKPVSDPQHHEAPTMAEPTPYLFFNFCDSIRLPGMSQLLARPPCLPALFMHTQTRCRYKTRLGRTFAAVNTM
jgi:hypothetical protein